MASCDMASAPSIRPYMVGPGGHTLTTITYFTAMAFWQELIAYKHSTYVRSPPPPPRIYMCMCTQGKSCSELASSARFQ